MEILKQIKQMCKDRRNCYQKNGIDDRCPMLDEHDMCLIDNDPNNWDLDKIQKALEDKDADSD